MAAAKSPRVLLVVAMLAVILAGGALRLVDLGADSFDRVEVDEINRTQAIRLPHDQVWRPVASLSTWVTAAVLEWGYGEATLRLPSAAAGTLTILAVWGLGAFSFGAEAGLYAAAAVAVAPLHVALSRSLGPDPWLTLFATLMVLTFTWAVQEPRDGRRQLVCAATAVLACGCAYRGLLVLAAVTIAAAVLAARQRPLRRLAVRSVLVLLLVAAIAGMLAVYHPPPLNGGFLRPAFGWPFPLQLLSQFAAGQPQWWWAGALLLAGVVVGLVSSAGSSPGAISAAWLLIGTAGLLFGEWYRRIAFRPTDLGFVVPVYLLLGAAGLARLRRAVCGSAPRPLAVGGQVAALVLLLAIALPGLADQCDQHDPSWRTVAQVLAANVRPDDALVVVAEQPSVAFYAPDLEPRLQPDVRPARAAAYFVHPKRGWLVVPDSLRRRRGWQLMERWLPRFSAVDLSPDAATVVLYLGQDGHDQLLFETAYFTLPTATLVRGTLVWDWLQQLGPVPVVLWKVDQIALSRQALDFHNPSLLHAVYYLAQHDHGDRAASLAYRLATAQPDWDEAQQALDAFRPTR
jgi:hypothetical protein